MKKSILILIYLGASGCLFAQTSNTSASGLSLGQADGILLSVTNASLVASAEGSVVTRQDPHSPVELIFKDCRGLGVSREHDQWWILPIDPHDSQKQLDHVEANSALWILPADAMSKDHSWYLKIDGGSLSAAKTKAGLRVTVLSDRFTMTQSEARPHSDSFNHRYSLKLTGGVELEDALAGFYWGTMLPSVVEKTVAANYPYSSGYVLSTLKTSAYAGSYPAVDHEFQIKGRLAIGSALDLDVVRRMIELQFKLMNDDPERLSRAPTSVQPDGRCEYHVRRSSKDDRQNAAMFPLTGNIEVIEEAWHYYQATKDAEWLRHNIANLEHAAAWTMASVDQYGRVWSDVYYEDQVIKDGRETQAQAFAAYTFDLLAKMEIALARHDQSAHYAEISETISKALIEPLPMGYWDEKNQRFVDWIDRDGKVHDHIHLLANALPVTFGYATVAQAEAVRTLIEANAAQFERFPSFLSADIAGYDDSEIGSGGPYDLSAAGRYWYWDAAYRESRKQNSVLFEQLKAVAAEGAKDNYLMGERYDMDYVYYIDGKNAHGAEKYYEYPNVYAAVLISKYLGLNIPDDADVSVSPHLDGYGSVEFDTAEYDLRYTYSEDGFVLQNLSDKERRFKVDLSTLGSTPTDYHLVDKSGSAVSGASSLITLSAHEEAHYIPTTTKAVSN